MRSSAFTGGQPQTTLKCGMVFGYIVRRMVTFLKKWHHQQAETSLGTLGPRVQPNWARLVIETSVWMRATTSTLGDSDSPATKMTAW